MNLRTEASRTWGLLRNHSLKWIGVRLLLEASKRSGQEERAYPARPWRANEWRAWVAPQWTDADPGALLADWRDGPGAAWGRDRRQAGWKEAYSEILGSNGRSGLTAAADDILAGRYLLFSRQVVSAGFPPPWLANPLADPTATPPEVHWSRVPMSGERFGELKFVWELSRASWAFTLARAYAATGEERFAEGFWRLWMDWIDRNPPNGSVNWKCGQECSLRLMAVTFAVQVCAHAAATTAERFARHLGAVGALADRIHRGRLYAELQDNNHSMSEGVGVYTAGAVYPQLREAAVWRRLGWTRLMDEAKRLIRDDGTFAQKSHNYHRVMLHLYLWATSLGEAAGDRFSADVESRLRAACEYLAGVVDPSSGEAPNFGANDGALVLPLEQASYTDYRPTVAAADFMTASSRPAPGAPGSEMVLWVFGTRSLSAAVGPRAAPRPLALSRGGVYTLRQEESWVFSHAEQFRDRPGQADQLHVDLWWRGLNIARDAGTYRYFGQRETFDWFRGSRCHNTVTVDDLDQMEPGPRFLWASRAQAWARVSAEAGLPALRLGHNGYERLRPPVRHERAVRALGSDTWLVVDELSSTAAHRYTLHWLLPDYPWRRDDEDLLVLDTPRGPFYIRTTLSIGSLESRDVHRAAEGAMPWGWESRYYNERNAALSLVVVARAETAHFATLFSPQRPNGMRLS